MRCSPCSCHILLKLESSRKILEKHQILEPINAHPAAAELFLADRQTDRHAEDNKRFS